MRILPVVPVLALLSACGDNYFTTFEPVAVTVSAVTGSTSEAGAQASFTVVLASEPAADVVFRISSSDVSEGTIRGTGLRFTPTSWNAPQLVTVEGVDDDLADGDVTFRIVLAPGESDDARFSALDPDDAMVVNRDNDTAGIVVSPTTGLYTTELGGQTSFGVFLQARPASDVTIGVSSSKPSEGTADRQTLTFTSANFNAPQVVAVTGVNDPVADGNQAYSIVLATAQGDPSYAAIDPADVQITNVDDETAGITVIRTSGLITSEAGGQDTFTIALNTQPTANVTIAVTSSDVSEGTISPASLTFTTANWSAPQTITVTGVDDLIADGDQLYSIVTAAAVSTDPGYSGRDSSDVSVTNTDNDSPSVLVAPTTGLVTSEAGGQATFSVSLATQPTADVTIGIVSSDPGEGVPDVASLTFTTVNWNAPRVVTLTGVDDLISDGSQPYTILTSSATSADPRYQNMTVPDVFASNTDNDSPGIVLSRTSGLVTSESGGQDTFTIVLASQPTSAVSISLSTSKPAEASVSPATVAFTTANWNAPQVVTATGLDDFVADGNQIYTIITAPAFTGDLMYAALDAPDVAAVNVDNDSPGIIVTPTSGLVTGENGAQATFSVTLSSQPAQPVTLNMMSSDTTEGTIAITSVLFTSANWNAPQPITVTGVNDASMDGNQPYSIVTAPLVSTDPAYSGINPPDVSLTNLDDDNGGIVVSPTSGLITTEAGGFATFSVVLLSAPAFDVDIPLSSTRIDEGLPSPTLLRFTAVNWASPQLVTATGVDDAAADGNQPYQIRTLAAISADATYNGFDATDVSLTNLDNDSPGIIVSPVSGLVTTENGGTDAFTIVLASQPIADVTITLSSSDLGEGTVAPTTVTFTSANWSSARTVTVTGVNDNLSDGNQPYTIVTNAATSGDNGYNGIDPSNVAVTNLDNDIASILVSPVSGLVTTEAGDFDVFTIVLGSQPSADVTIGLSSSDLTEGTVVPASLTFTTVNWFMPQSVTVTGVNDVIVDGNVVYTVVTAPAVSADPAYSLLDAANVSVTNLDNDGAGFTLDPTGGLIVSEFGDSDTFTIVLNTQPTSNVTIALTSTDLTEGTVSPASVTFTPGNWNIPQTVTVTGVNDALVDGNQMFFITTAPAVSADLAYAGLNPPDIDVTNVDNETAQVYIQARKRMKTSESGMTSFFRIRLTVAPTAAVTCTFSSSDTTEGTVAPATAVFTPGNFANQQITVSGVDDMIVDGAVLYTIITAPCTSSDPAYNNANPRDIAVVNRDND